MEEQRRRSEEEARRKRRGREEEGMRVGQSVSVGVSARARCGRRCHMSHGSGVTCLMVQVSRLMVQVSRLMVQV